MNVFGTEMHVVTFVFVLLEIIMFFYQLLYYLFRPQDKSRMWYLVLLSLLIIYNITGGLFPDPKLDIPIKVQNIAAYGSGFLMASYFPYYFYRAFELKRLRFHALYGVPLFLILPYILFFVIGYSIDGDLNLAIRYGVAVPFIYSIVLLYAISRAVWLKYKERTNQNNFIEVLAVYCAIIPWASLALLSYLHASQLVEVVCTNGGFIVITVLFISRYIAKARVEYEQLKEFNNLANQPSIFEQNCKYFQLTSREAEIVGLIRQGCKYKDIADKLFRSEKTVTKHVQNVFEKVGVNNRTELLHKLEQKPISGSNSVSEASEA
ncbi:response regulator transcription factor [Pedobacter sp. SYSU D00535]|uniref:response regulator transcription factor n=1 Tax=Pedobacter sp. SYSU D00535 TaxID=2810308 RepID=UPI001A975E59|nr:LuxR C-terminal-related transcriptional regulator [Pedobacter sp. SYSU D00535]